MSRKLEKLLTAFFVPGEGIQKLAKSFGREITVFVLGLFQLMNLTETATRTRSNHL